MTVSVIIPCYNAERYLAQTIGSVLNQSLPPSEIIVVDDGSTDDSLSVARRFDDYVRVVSKENGGAAEARNVGASRATGEALMFLDADDVLGPAVLEALTAALHREPGTIAICPWYCLRQVKGKWVQRGPNCSPRRIGQDDLSAWLTDWFHPPCSVLWSRAAFNRVDAWDEQVSIDDDGEIMMRAMVKGVSLVRASYGASYYRRLPEDESSLSDARHTESGIRSSIYVIVKIARMLEERGTLQEYEMPLGEAFDRIAERSKDRYPELYAQCAAYAKKYSGPPWLREARRTWSQLLSKGERAWRRTMPFAEPTQRFPESSEIRFGLDWKNCLSEQASRADAGKSDAGHQPLVSVIIPTYNRADLLPRALDSVLAQTFDDFEVLAIDDASTDDTAEVVRNYQDARVQYMRQPENRGVSAARNRGLREARGRFIAFLDSDDEWLPQKLKLQIQRFRELPSQVGLLYTGGRMVYNGDAERVKRPAHRGDVYGDLLAENFVYPTSGVMMRSEVVEEIGYFDEHIPANEDWDYWLRIARHFEVDYVEDVLVRYFAGSGRERKSLIAEDDLDARARIYKKNAVEMRCEDVAFPFLMESARRHMGPPCWDAPGARQLLWRAMRLRPWAPELYAKFLRSLLPRRGYLFLRDKWKRIHRFGVVQKVRRVM